MSKDETPGNVQDHVAQAKKDPRQEAQDHVDEIKKDLREEAGYKEEESTSWLEHYNAACILALPMRGDKEEKKGHLPYAYAAISALERALRYGQDADFVGTKRYWLQAGDPDLAGLRQYECFRAFETRVYGRPLTATVNLAKYELYRYLRAVLEDGAGQLEREWRRRAVYDPSKLTHADFEEWWRQERHAWELAIRLGRFYRQWQTRRDAVEARRNWIEAFGHEAQPLSYPNISLPDYTPYTGDPKAVEKALEETEEIFMYLGDECGSLMPAGGGICTPNVMENTRQWSHYAAKCSWSVAQKDLMRREVICACQMRAAVWAALRNWAQFPSNVHRDGFEDTIKKLKAPPLG